MTQGELSAVGSSTNKIKPGDDFMISRITAAEREALRLFDALIDAEPMTSDDYRQIEADERLLFPEVYKEKDKRNARNRRLMERKAETGELAELKEKQRRYYEENREKIKARKAEWYRQNRERILAQQREYQAANRQRRNEWQRERRHNALAADALPVMA